MKLKKLLTSIGALAVTVMLTASVAASAATSNLRATPGIKIPDLKFTAQTLPQNDALKFTAGMGAGINLGNAFDGHNALPYNASTEMSYENVWGSTTLTKENILAVKNAGFKTIRLPVSWHNHVTDDKFTISKAWLDRYQTVVDWIVKEGMYVIVNIHHDDDVKYYYPDSKHLESSWKFMSAIWTQVSERFKNYDNHVIFESINEPRLVGTANEWRWADGNAIVLDSLKTIIELNQRFVSLVRKSGGKNAERYLMVPSYDTFAHNAVVKEFTLPTDTATNKIIVSVHSYAPSPFCQAEDNDPKMQKTFDIKSKTDTGEIDTALKELYERFTKNGVPVVVGEFGARDHGGNTQARTDFAAYFTALASSYGITSVWWDNANFNTQSFESYAIIDRRNNTFKYPDIAIALVKYAR
jgi:endoglucanase